MYTHSLSLKILSSIIEDLIRYYLQYNNIKSLSAPIEGTLLRVAILIIASPIVYLYDVRSSLILDRWFVVDCRNKERQTTTTVAVAVIIVAVGEGEGEEYCYSYTRIINKRRTKTRTV